MLVVETIARIRREYFVKGKPIKEIVRDVKVSRNTVRKVIRSQATAFTYDRRVQPMPKLGPWTAELERMLEANETKSKRERLTLLRISEALEGLGYGGGYDAVRRYAKAWRWRRSASTAQTYVPLVFSPGEAYQFDWSHEYVVLAGVTTKVKVAHVRLCHSRMFFVRAYPRESQEMVFDAHDRAFRLFQGACRRGTEADPELAAFFARTGAEIVTSENPRAYYSPVKDHIHMPPIATFHNAAGYYGTLAHETIHWTGSEKRLERIKKFANREAYAFEELVALS